MLDKIDVVDTTIPQVIEASLVEEGARLDFLPKHVPGRFMVFESGVFRQMGMLCEEYDGALWQFNHNDESNR